MVLKPHTKKGDLVVPRRYTHIYRTTWAVHKELLYPPRNPSHLGGNESHVDEHSLQMCVVALSFLCIGRLTILQEGWNKRFQKIHP